MDLDLYSKKTLYNFFHKFRFKKTMQFLDKTLHLSEIKFDSYNDFGCFNGYVTGLIADKYDIAEVTGYDHNMSALEVAKET